MNGRVQKSKNRGRDVQVDKNIMLDFTKGLIVVFCAYMFNLMVYHQVEQSNPMLIIYGKLSNDMLTSCTSMKFWKG